jgi:hypothetical protein
MSAIKRQREQAKRDAQQRKAERRDERKRREPEAQNSTTSTDDAPAS